MNWVGHGAHAYDKRHILVAKLKKEDRLEHLEIDGKVILKWNLTFRGPCIVIYSCNRSQQEALFLHFILVKNSTCFRQIYCPSSGVLILYSQQLVFVILVMLAIC